MRNRLGDRLRDWATSRTTGADSTTMGVLFRKAEATPQAAIISQRPRAPSLAHMRVAYRMTSPSRPDSSMA